MLSRLIWGCRLSLIAGFVPVLVGGTIGTILGIAAGMGSRWINTAIMRTLDVFYSFPDILLAIASPQSSARACGMRSWPLPWC